MDHWFRWNSQCGETLPKPQAEAEEWPAPSGALHAEANVSMLSLLGWNKCQHLKFFFDHTAQGLSPGLLWWKAITTWAALWEPRTVTSLFLLFGSYLRYLAIRYVRFDDCMIAWLEFGVLQPLWRDGCFVILSLNFGRLCCLTYGIIGPSMTIVHMTWRCLSGQQLDDFAFWLVVWCYTLLQWKMWYNLMIKPITYRNPYTPISISMIIQPSLRPTTLTSRWFWMAFGMMKPSKRRPKEMPTFEKANTVQQGPQKRWSSRDRLPGIPFFWDLKEEAMTSKSLPNWPKVCELYDTWICIDFFIRRDVQLIICDRSSIVSPLRLWSVTTAPWNEILIATSPWPTEQSGSPSLLTCAKGKILESIGEVEVSPRWLVTGKMTTGNPGLWMYEYKAYSKWKDPFQSFSHDIHSGSLQVLS